MAKHPFQTEVSQLLHLIIHSLYSHKEIFLRELISNASDALDKLKFSTLTDEKYKALAFTPRIDIHFDGGESRILSISDTGIGMTEKELEENLGTIAKSGTRNFIQNLTGDARKDSNLIGQFGVGFYSSFMVAGKVEVVSRRAGEEKAFKWTSDGQGEYEITEAVRESAGTTVTLFLNDEGREYADRWKIDSVIKKYSNHIAFPIFLTYEKTEYDDKGKEKSKGMVTEQVNSASALWKRSKSELKDEDYKEFYKTLSHDYEEPMHWVHTRAEGTLDYTTLFYFPGKPPLDLFHADYKAGVKLYVKRIFITDDDRELMPVYLRFVRGVIDSEDLPLNVSREILQQNRVMAKIRSSSVKKILSELESIQKSDRAKYEEFFKAFGVPLKEGLYQDFENRELLTELVMFKSTGKDGYSTLTEYAGRMKPDQKSIFYITGENENNLRHSPLLEMYKNRNIEVLILDDKIDEIVISSVPKYKEFELKSVNRSDAANDLKTDDDKKKEQAIEPVVQKVKKALGDLVKDVKASARLSDSPSCIVADEKDPTVQMQHLLKAMGQKNVPDFKPILEINPNHAIVTRLQDMSDEKLIEDVSHLLLEQAMLIEGVELKDPKQFVDRLNRIMGKVV